MKEKTKTNQKQKNKNKNKQTKNKKKSTTKRNPKSDGLICGRCALLRNNFKIRH